jgi:hypothetical protein
MATICGGCSLMPGKAARPGKNRGGLGENFAASQFRLNRAVP